MATVIDTIPELRAGDHLAADEFIRRWENEPKIRRAELIGGVVYIPSPVSFSHGEMEWTVGLWLGVYQSATPGTGGAHNATTFMLDDVPQPDLLLRVLPESGGQTSVEDNWLHGAPELIFEVCQTSEAYDLHEKLNLYQEAKVREYVTVLVHSGTIRWHRLVDDAYQIVNPDAAGVYRSRDFPGLWLDGPALLARQSDRVLEELKKGLDSPEHAEFVAKLAAARSK